MATTLDKHEAHALIDKMPDGATWDDLIHEICVREAIEIALADSREGPIKDVQTSG